MRHIVLFWFSNYLEIVKGTRPPPPVVVMKGCGQLLGFWLCKVLEDTSGCSLVLCEGTIIRRDWFVNKVLLLLWLLFIFLCFRREAQHWAQWFCRNKPSCFVFIYMWGVYVPSLRDLRGTTSATKPSGNSHEAKNPHWQHACLMQATHLVLASSCPNTIDSLHIQQFYSIKVQKRESEWKKLHPKRVKTSRWKLKMLNNGY